MSLVGTLHLVNLASWFNFMTVLLFSQQEYCAVFVLSAYEECTSFSSEQEEHKLTSIMFSNIRM